jgi:DNA polymerase-3 subunit delta'
MLIGHHRQLQYLKNLAETGKIPHALLFYGQSQLGKRTAALEFVKLISCHSALELPTPGILKTPEFSCSSCSSCLEIEKGIYPDLKAIGPLEKEIKIAQVREVIHFLSLKPFYKLKAVLIDQAHLMSKEAQGCLLKTLEEPPGKAILILITEQPEMLLPTVLSRVQRLSFFAVEQDELARHLVLKGAPENRARDLSMMSFGKPGRAIELLSDKERIKKEELMFQGFLTSLGSSLADSFQYVKELNQDKSFQLRETFELWLFYLRSILQKQNFGDLRAKKALVAVEKALFLTESTNVNSRLLLENVLLELSF